MCSNCDEVFVVSVHKSGRDGGVRQRFENNFYGVHGVYKVAVLVVFLSILYKGVDIFFSQINA